MKAWTADEEATGESRGSGAQLGEGVEDGGHGDGTGSAVHCAGNWVVVVLVVVVVRVEG